MLAITKIAITIVLCLTAAIQGYAQRRAPAPPVIQKNNDGLKKSVVKWEEQMLLDFKAIR